MQRRDHSLELLRLSDSLTKSNSERDACERTLLTLGEVGYGDAMISCLEFTQGGRFIVADKDLALGEKFKRIAEHTRRSYDHPTDLLPLVLSRRQSRFVLDSREDKENHQELCQNVNLI